MGNPIVYPACVSAIFGAFGWRHRSVSDYAMLAQGVELVEMMGLEPTASTLRTWRSPN